MLSRKIFIAMAAGLTMVALSGAHAQDKGSLTPQDYIEIRQLIENYPNLLDTCTNSGYDYADQYTDDATFGVASSWDGPWKVWFEGRERLAVAAGGGKDGCKPRSGNNHHIVTSPVITPTAEGASARSVLMMTSGATGAAAPKIEWQGGYKDTLVKTSKGWRFKSQFHVWPGYDWPDTAAEMAARQAAARKAQSK